MTTAVRHARTLGLPLGIGGWSFGAWMALQWVADNRSEIPYVGVAPRRRCSRRAPDEPETIVLGTRDQVIDGEALQSTRSPRGSIWC